MTTTPDLATMPPTFRAGLDAALSRPLLLDQRSLAPVRAAAGFRPRASSRSSDDGAGPEPFERDGDVAVVSITGPLSQRAWSCWMFEGDGYDAIVQRVAGALGDSAVRAVVLRIDSPGGEVAGCFEAVRSLRAMASAAGKPMVAYADEMACSAAYAIACACAEVVLPDTGMVGSVGVILTVESYAEQLAAEGVAVNLITSGAAKADGHPAIALADDARARLQADIDQLARVFAAEVSVARPLDPAAVLALEARTFLGETAVAAGLADAVGPLAAAVDRARALASGEAPRAARAPAQTARKANLSHAPAARRAQPPTARTNAMTLNASTEGADAPAKPTEPCSCGGKACPACDGTGACRGCGGICGQCQGSAVCPEGETQTPPPADAPPAEGTSATLNRLRTELGVTTDAELTAAVSVLKVRAASADAVSRERDALREQLAARDAAQVAQARVDVLTKHRARGALSPAMERDAVFMGDLAPLSPESLDRVLSRLSSAPAAASPRKVDAIDPSSATSTSGAITDDDRKFAKSVGVSEEALAKAIADEQRRAAARVG